MPDYREWLERETYLEEQQAYLEDTRWPKHEPATKDKTKEKKAVLAIVAETKDRATNDGSGQ